MKVLIVDDERPARRELAGLLEEHSFVHVCGEAANIAAAAELVQTQRPDLLFLDIQMPGGTGFDLLESLPPPHPLVVFTTAFSEHAVRAFTVNSLDYLLKPVQPERLAAALEKVRTSLADTGGPGPAAAAPLAPADQVFLRSGDRCWFVPVKSIRIAEAVGNQTRIHFGSESAIQPRTLASLEERLPPRLFIRANRSQLVNLDKIRTVGEWFSRSLKVVLDDGQEVEFSRRQAQVFRERLSL